MDCVLRHATVRTAQPGKRRQRTGMSLIRRKMVQKIKFIKITRKLQVKRKLSLNGRLGLFLEREYKLQKLQKTVCLFGYAA